MMPAITVLDFQEFQEVQEQPNLLSTNAFSSDQEFLQWKQFFSTSAISRDFRRGGKHVCYQREIPRKISRKNVSKKLQRKTKLPPLRRSKKEESNAIFFCCFKCNWVQGIRWFKENRRRQKVGELWETRSPWWRWSRQEFKKQLAQRLGVNKVLFVFLQRKNP